MIPLTDEQTLKVKTKSGKEIELKYLTEFDDQVKYLELTKEEQEEIKEIESKATKNEKKISREIAYQILQNNRANNPKENLYLIDSYIDIFVIGGKKFRLFEKYEIYRLIQNNIVELTGLTVDEIKN
jgi:hypothetical protein